MEDFPTINFVIRIDSTNVISIISEKEKDFLNNKMAKTVTKYVDKCNESLTKELAVQIEKYFNIIIPKRNVNDLLTNSKAIAKALFFKYKVCKKDLEPSIRFLQASYHEKDSFLMTKESICHLGKLLMYSYYKKLYKTKIRTQNQFNTALESIKNKTTNIIQLCELYDSQLSIIAYFKIFRKQYTETLPPEMIFIINIMSSVKKIEFELDKLEQMSFDLYILIIINTQWIFQSLDNVSMIITENELQKHLYARYEKALNHKEDKSFKTIKKTNFKRGINFKRKPLYDLNYLVIKEESYSRSQSLGEINPYKTFSSLETTNSDINDSQFILCSIDDLNGKFEDIVKRFMLGLEYLIISTEAISKWKITKLSLSFSETFQQEIAKGLAITHHVDIKDFDFFNYYSTINQLKELNIEFNSLNYKTFESIMFYIMNNQDLNHLRLSLFLSEPHYTAVGLFKTLSSITSRWKNIFENQSRSINFDNDNIDQVIVNNLLIHFKDNLSFLFWILKSTPIPNLTIILDSPSIILDNDKYLMVLCKFIFNLLLMIYTSYTKDQTIRILAPFLKMDHRQFPDIEDFFELINGNVTQSLKYFSLQIQFYDVNNLGRLLSNSLLSLHIGDLDVTTFDNFVVAFTSYDFEAQSQLQITSIGLLPTIYQYTSIKRSIIKLFNSKIKLLSKLELRSNMIIERREFKLILNSIDFGFIREFSFIVNNTSISLLKSNMTHHYYCNLGDIHEWLLEFQIKFRSKENIIKHIISYLFQPEIGIISII